MNITRIERGGSVEFGFSALPWQGILSCLLLIAQVVLLLSALYASYAAEGDGGLLVGVAGLLVIIFAVAGVVIAIFGLVRKDIRHGLCLTGGCGSLIILAGMIVMCILA